MQRERMLTIGIPHAPSVTARRLIALALSFSVTLLGAVRADAACATHGERTSVAPSAEGAPYDHHDALPHPTSDDAACDTPVLPECCRALAACSLTLGSADADSVNDPQVLHGLMGTALDRAPLSRVTTPDPPPPRA